MLNANGPSTVATSNEQMICLQLATNSKESSKEDWDWEGQMEHDIQPQQHARQVMCSQQQRHSPYAKGIQSKAQKMCGRDAGLGKGRGRLPRGQTSASFMEAEGHASMTCRRWRLSKENDACHASTTFLRAPGNSKGNHKTTSGEVRADAP